MEGFWLVVSIPILGSNNVSVQVFLCCPGGLVEKLGVILESRGYCACSVSFGKQIVKLAVGNWFSLEGIWFTSVVGLEIGLSECSSPLIVETGMRLKHSFFSITSVETRSSFIKSLLIHHEINALESIMRFLEIIFLIIASSSNFSVNSSEFRVSPHSRDKS